MSQSEKNITQDSAKDTETTTNKYKGFSAEERAAMKERAKEQKAEARANKNRAEGESDVLAKIAEMPERDRAMAERLHALIKASAPALSPRTWYGMPAYAKDGKVVCFFQSGQKFKTRYATLGFSDHANPSGSVKEPLPPPITIRCEPVPSGDTPASLASARRP